MKKSTDYNRKELLTMLTLLRSELHTILYIDEELDEDRLEEIKLTLEATNMDIDDSDVDENGEFEKKWFDVFLENYSK